MKVAVLLSVFNGEKTLEKALSSIHSQTRNVDQVVIVNDSSTDATEKIIASWEKKLPITLIKNKKNQGLSYSLSEGMKHASADWVFRLDADDYWDPGHVEKLLNQVLKNEKSVIVSSRAIFINSLGGILGVSKACSNQNVRSLLMWDNPLVHSCTAFRRDMYFRVGGYRQVKWEDYDLWIRLLLVGDLVFEPEATCYYFVSESSLSRIGRIVSISARWDLQKAAIRIFFVKHPFSSLFCYLFFGARLSFLRFIRAIT